MARLAQIGIALGSLGLVLAFMGLFPGVTGLPPTPGIGVVQVIMVLTGFGLLIIGAIIYVKFTFYSGIASTLAQQIGLRLALTGLVFAAMSGMADFLGFGSHLQPETGDIFLGPWQALGLISSFVLSAIGVLIYAVSGNFQHNGEN